MVRVVGLGLVAPGNCFRIVGHPCSNRWVISNFFVLISPRFLGRHVGSKLAS